MASITKCHHNVPDSVILLLKLLLATLTPSNDCLYRFVDMKYSNQAQLESYVHYSNLNSLGIDF